MCIIALLYLHSVYGAPVVDPILSTVVVSVTLMLKVEDFIEQLID